MTAPDRRAEGRRPSSAVLDPASRPWARVLPWVALAVYFFLCLFAWAEDRWRPEWDSALYLLMGKSLAAGEGYVYQGDPFFLRPPGFSFLLALLVEDGSYDLAGLGRLMMATAATAVLAIYLALRTVSGGWTALAVALLAGTCPLFVRNFNWVLSEFPFATFLFLAIGCLQVSARRGRRWWVWATAGGLCLAAALYLRSAGLLLLPGMLLLGARSDRGRQRWRPLLAVALAVAAIAPWLVYASGAGAEAQRPSEQLLLHDYPTAMFRVDPGDPDSALVSFGDWVERLRAHVPRLAGEVSRAVLHVDHPAAAWVLAAVLLTGLGLAVRRRPSLFEWFAVAYAALVVTYFTYDERLVRPLAPFPYLYLLTAVGAGGRRLGARLERARLAQLLPAGAFALLLVLNLWNLPRHLDAASWADDGATHGQHWQDVGRIAEWLEANTPEDATVLCHRAPILALLTGRRTATYRHMRRPDLIDRSGADYVVLDGPVPPELRQEARDRADRRWLLRSSVPGRRIAILRMPRP